MSVGINVGNLSAEAIQAQTAKRAAEALANGVVNPIRIDGSRNAQADSGRKLWGNDGLSLGSLGALPRDLNAAGYTFTKAYLTKKEGDRMYSLRMWWEKTDAPPLAVSDDAKELFDAILGSAFEHVHGFVNPDGSMTINPSHRVDGTPRGTVKLLHFAADGNVTYERV